MYSKAHKEDRSTHFFYPTSILSRFKTDKEHTDAIYI